MMLDQQYKPYGLGDFIKDEKSKRQIDKPLDIQRRNARDQLILVQKFYEFFNEYLKNETTDDSVVALILATIVESWNNFEKYAAELPPEITDPVYGNAELQDILKRAGVPPRS